MRKALMCVAFTMVVGIAWASGSDDDWGPRIIQIGAIIAGSIAMSLSRSLCKRKKGKTVAPEHPSTKEEVDDETHVSDWNDGQPSKNNPLGCGEKILVRNWRKNLAKVATDAFPLCSKI